MQATRRALALAEESAPKSSDARMAMMAITTSNSIRVKALDGPSRLQRSPLRQSAVSVFVATASRHYRVFGKREVRIDSYSKGGNISSSFAYVMIARFNSQL